MSGGMEELAEAKVIEELTLEAYTQRVKLYIEKNGYYLQDLIDIFLPDMLHKELRETYTNVLEGLEPSKLTVKPKQLTQEDTAIKLKKREKVLDSVTTKFTLCTGIYITITKDTEGRPLEVFAKIGKAGGCPAAQIDGICRAISVGLRSGVPVETYIKTLQGIICNEPRTNDGVLVTSCSDAIAKTLKEVL